MNTPICDFVRQYREKRPVRLHMPGHKGRMILGVVTAVVGLFGLLQALDLLSGVPVLAFGVPAVLSLYFDLFSGFVQALVFSLLSMVYIAGSCPAPESGKAA